jgi:filamentous hemagglutinin family protein
VVVVVLHATAAQAQVTTAITPTPGVGAVGTVVNQVGNTVDITGGTRAGGNLFHSFGLFSVGPGDIANFSNTTGAGVANILGRVTGGQVSGIQGTIQTTNFPGANLFLLNPAGWVFGPGAALNVSGSFHVSTADYIRFADPAQSVFCVGACPNGQPSVLSVAAPAAFGFLGPSQGSISIQLQDPTTLQPGTLQVPERATLSVVGGGVQIDSAILSAPGGRVQIGSFASAGEATVNGLEGSFAALGPIQVSNSSISTTGTAGFDGLGNFVGVDGGSVLIRGGDVSLSAVGIDASGAGTFDDLGNLFGTTAGTVVIRGGRLTLTGTSVTNFNQGSGSPGVAIRLEASGDVVMDGGSALQSTALLSGDAGAVQVQANSLTMREFASINSDTQGGGRGADISIDVGQLTLEGGARIGSSASAFVPPAGAGGDITVKATGAVTITGESSGIVSLGLSSEPTASGGALTVSAQSLTLSDLASIGTTALGPAPGGKVAISVADLSVTGGGTISSTTFQGQGGDVSVTATGSALISGAGSAISSGGNAASLTIAPAGNIAVNAGTLTVADFGVIQNGTSLDVAGNIAVTATKAIVLQNGGAILSQAFTNNVGNVTISAPSLTIDNGLIQTSTIQEGNAGNIDANVGTLTLTGGGQIVASSALSATGAGGSIHVTANDVFASGQSPSGTPVSTFSLDPRSGIFSTTDGVGAAGQIVIAAGTVNLADAGRIDSSTTGAGQGGTIALNASTSLSLGGGAGLFSTAEGTGAAGSIVATSPTVTMSQGSTISVATTGAGSAGSIQLSGGSVALAGGAQLNSSTAAGGLGGSITVNAGNVSISDPGSGLFSTATGPGDAGQITVSGGSVSLGNQAQISASASAAGRAGTIGINTGSLSLDGGGSLLSNASGTGPGGDINIAASDVSMRGGSTISANSTGSAEALAGSINVVFGNTFSLTGGSAVTTSSLLADGGNISITSTGSTLSLFDSQIITSVQSGLGQGGNISLGSDLHPLGFLILSDGQIRADAFGGPGGNIRVFADTFLSSGGILSASSALSAPGTIDVQTRFTDLDSALVQLPENLLQATTLLRASCAARLAQGKTSSLVVAGREGVPPEPDGLLTSPVVLEGWTDRDRPAAAEPGLAAPLLALRWPTALGETCR